MLARMPMRRFWNWLAFYELEYGPKPPPPKPKQTWQQQMKVMQQFFRGRP